METLNAKKSFRCRSTHFFAKTNIFSLCVGVLKKNTNTKDAQTQLHIKLKLTASFPVIAKILDKTKSKSSCFLRLPLVVAMWRKMQNKHLCLGFLCLRSCATPAFSGRIKLATFRRKPKYVLLLLFEERHGKGDPRGNVLVPFLSPFLCGTTKKWHSSLHRSARGEAAQYDRQKKKL